MQMLSYIRKAIFNLHLLRYCSGRKAEVSLHASKIGKLRPSEPRILHDNAIEPRLCPDGSIPLAQCQFRIFEPQNITAMALVITTKKNKGLRQQMLELLNKKAKSRKPRWDLFFGKVTFDSDPVEYQRSMRDE